MCKNWKKNQKLSKHYPNSPQIHFGPLSTSQGLPNDNFVFFGQFLVWNISHSEPFLVLIWPSLHKNTTTGCPRYVQKLKKIQKLSKHHPNSPQIDFGPLSTSQSLPNDKFQKKVWKIPLKWAIFCQIAPPLILLMFGVFWYFEVLNLENLIELMLYKLKNLWSTLQLTSDPNIVTIKTNKDS